MDLKEYLTTLSKENLIFLTQLGLFYQTVFKCQNFLKIHVIFYIVN